MKIKNINRVITNSGNTSEIINVVMYAYDQERDPQIKELAYQLQGATEWETCRNIWRYLIDNITYRADSEGTAGEMIKTPARLVHDGIGDCKSYSLFTAVILRFLGIKHFFRFASYTQKKEATHVYIVAFPRNTEHETRNTKHEIIIDAVASVQLYKPFNTEIKYSYKADMSNGNTKISYLAGFNPLNPERETRNAKRISGDANSDERYAVWIGDDSQTNITPGKAWLYSKYDLLNEQINISTSNKQIARLYNELSIIAAMLWAYDYVRGVSNSINQMIYIICGLIYKGKFSSTSVDQNTRDNMFEDIIEFIKMEYNANIQPAKVNKIWYSLFVSNLLIYNRLPQTNSINGIGSFNLFYDAMKKAGIYFIYLFIPENELKNYDAKVAKKRKTQKFFRDLIIVASGHSTAYMMDTFRAGIIARVGMEPEAYIKKIKTENVKSVGSLTVTLATIGSILAIILALLEIIKAIWPNSEASKYAVSSGAADLENDIYSTKTNTNTGTGTNILKSSGTWIFAALGLGTLLMKRK